MNALTLVHVVISLVAILTGLVFLFGLIAGKEFEGWTVTFLATTVATSMTGFFFPFKGITPAIVFGIISVFVLAIAIYAKYSRNLAAAWRKTFLVTALVALYLNVFVLVVQAFLKVPPLKGIAPTQNDPAFKITQLAVLLAFITCGILAWKRFVPSPSESSSTT